ncbi:MAG: MtaA/CmuA family methyltransferase [Anaerolineae bacterium]|nr:MtaA/CmuA family methyltransferase [Anaerolineae bacterium]
MSTAYEMTPKRRFLSGMLGGRVDRPPVGSATSVANVEQMEITGAFFPDVHVDGLKMARLAAAAHDVLGYDAIMPYFSVQAEAAALGCHVDWGDVENMPVETTHPWSDPEQVVIPDDFLSQPSIKAVLDAIAILRHTHGHRVAIVGKVMGPWTLSYHLHGVQDFLAETILDPARVRSFLDKLQEVTVLFGLAQIRAGADALCLADHATGDLVGPWTYRDFLLPYHRKLTQRLGCPTILHICGDTLDRLDGICTAGFDGFHFDSKVDARAAVRRVDGRISLIGNVNNPEILLRGTPDQVAERTRYALAAGVQVVGPECAIPLRTPLENLTAIARVAKGEM